MAVFNEKEMNNQVKKKSEVEPSLKPLKQTVQQEKKKGEVVKIKGFKEKKETKPAVSPFKEDKIPKKKVKRNMMQLLGNQKKNEPQPIARIDEESGEKNKKTKKKKK